MAQSAALKAPLPSPIPDVRGLEYRVVTMARPVGASEIYVPGVKSRPQPAVHLWILPTKNGEPARGLGWNGVEYELKSVEELADWRADVEAFLKPRVEGERYFLPRTFEFSGQPISQAYLDQLGAPELRRQARLRMTSYGNANPEAEYWRNLRDAGVGAFVSGDFSEARRQLQVLLAALPAEIPRNIPNPRAEATLVLADIERRLHDAPRPSDKIAGLIWDLQNVRAHQFSSPGNLGWTQERVVQQLIDESDAAVEPLLNSLENDARLTLSVRLSRADWRRPGSLGTVREAAQSALEVLLKHRYSSTSFRLGFEDQQRDIARQMRADWQKLKGDSPVERIYKTLAQPDQTPQRLEEAARELVRLGKPYNGTFIEGNGGTLRFEAPSQVFFGEPLRTRSNPSVSDLLEARIEELTNRALNGRFSPSALDPTLPTSINDPNPYVLNTTLRTANELAWLYAKWEPKRAWPLLGAQLQRSKTYVAKAPRGIAEDARRNLNRTRRQFLAARLNSPFRAAAMREYGEFLQEEPFGRLSQEEYAPLWLLRDEPAIKSATHTLFAAPLKPFQAIAQWKTRDFDYDSAFRLLHSPLIQNPLFQVAVLRELSNKTVIGTLSQGRIDQIDLKMTAWDWSAQGIILTAAQRAAFLQRGKSQPLRVCDLVGFWLREDRSAKNSQSRHYPLLDVSLSVSQRDARLSQIAQLVKQKKVVSEEIGFAGLEF
ncbi:MAG TPA: hypothetical protein VF627_03250 [Abditibacterium sp.]